MTSTNPDIHFGRTAIDQQGNKVGIVGRAHVDRQTGQPVWIVIGTGLFGSREHLAPVHGTSFNGQNLVLPFDRKVLEDSPAPDSDALSVDFLKALQTYYQSYLTGGSQAFDIDSVVNVPPVHGVGGSPD